LLATYRLYSVSYPQSNTLISLFLLTCVVVGSKLEFMSVTHTRETAESILCSQYGYESSHLEDLPEPDVLDTLTLMRELDAVAEKDDKLYA
jgi:hypothetical protein